MHQTFPAGVLLDQGRGGLPRLTVSSPLCTAEIYLQGAHLCRWHPRAQAHPVLWMSQDSVFQAGSPIRGGVPICFPWFGPKAGNPKAPGHGIARISQWTLDGASAEADGIIEVRLSLDSATLTGDYVPGPFKLGFTVRLGGALSMALSVANAGSAPLTFEEALHTYVTVSDVRAVRLDGLAGATYIDKTDGMTRKVQAAEPITIGAETDRLFVGTTTPTMLTDPGFRRTITVAKSGSKSTVVWNPWVAKSKAMPDFGDHEWPAMICIETANAADDAVTLAPGASHTMTATLAVAGA